MAKSPGRLIHHASAATGRYVVRYATALVTIHVRRVQDNVLVCDHPVQPPEFSKINSYMRAEGGALLRACIHAVMLLLLVERANGANRHVAIELCSLGQYHDISLSCQDRTMTRT